MSRTSAQIVLSPGERYDIKALNLDEFLPTAWTGAFGGDGDAVDVETAYERVAVVRTAVTLRRTRWRRCRGKSQPDAER